MADIPHISLPLRFTDYHAGGSVQMQVTEQDSEEEIKDCVTAICRYEKQQRPEAPDFGIVPQMFHVEMDTDGIIESVRKHEPRVDALIKDVRDPLDVMIRDIVISISENLSNTSGGGNNA